MRALAGHYAPPSVLIDSNLQALYYHGAMERFLKPRLEEPTQDLTALARDGLGLRVRRLVEKAKETNRPQSDRGQLRWDGKTSHVLIDVIPAARESGEPRLLAIRPGWVGSGNTHIEQIWPAEPPEPDSSSRAQISPR